MLVCGLAQLQQCGETAGGRLCSGLDAQQGQGFELCGLLFQVVQHLLHLASQIIATAAHQFAPGVPQALQLLGGCEQRALIRLCARMAGLASVFIQLRKDTAQLPFRLQ